MSLHGQPPRIPDPPEIGPDQPGIPGIGPQECRVARADIRPEGLRGWTIDLCANVMFKLVKRPIDHYLDSNPAPRRRWEFRSTHPIRAQGYDLPIFTGREPCRLHYARMAKGPDNRWRPVYCTRPARDMVRFSVAQFFNRAGRALTIGGFGTPMWTEVVVNNSRRYCLPPDA